MHMVNDVPRISLQLPLPSYRALQNIPTLLSVDISSGLAKKANPTDLTDFFVTKLNLY